MARSVEEVLEDLEQDLTFHANSILGLFKPDALVTIVVRFPNKPKQDVVFTCDEDYEAIKDSITRARSYDEVVEEKAPLND